MLASIGITEDDIALTAAGITFSSAEAPEEASPVRPARTFRVDADAELIGRIASEASVPLIELRSADGAGLEDMFLELTADTQREAPPDSRRPGTPEPALAEGAVA